MTPSPLTQIESATFKYSKARAELGDLVGVLHEQIEALKRTHLSAIKQAVGRASKCHGELKAIIEAHPGAFTQPRTQTFHGIKVGFRKGSGGIAFDDAAKVVELVEKHFADLADTLIKTTKVPIKKALENLDVAQLKKIGCTVSDTGDEVVIKPVDGEVEKAVNALLKDATKDTEKEEAA